MVVNGKIKKLTEENGKIQDTLLYGEEKENALNSPEINKDGLVNLSYDIWYFLIISILFFSSLKN